MTVVSVPCMLFTMRQHLRNRQVQLRLALLLAVAVILVGCNPFGLRDSDEERVQTVADAVDAFEDEDWTSLREYFGDKAEYLSDQGINAAARRSLVETTYSPSNWVYDEFDKWSLVRYPADAPWGAVVRSHGEDWIIDPGLRELVHGRLVTDVTPHYLYHTYDARTPEFQIDSDADRPAPGSVLDVGIDATRRDAADLTVALTLVMERKGRASISLDDMYWTSGNERGDVELLWTHAPLVENESAIEMHMPGDGRYPFRFDVELIDVPDSTDEVAVVFENIHVGDLDVQGASEMTITASGAIPNESRPDFNVVDSIPTPFQAHFADMPFEMLEPAYVPIDYDSPAIDYGEGPGVQQPDWAMIQYRDVPEDIYLELALREATDDLYLDGGDIVTIESGAEARFLDDGQQTVLNWVDPERDIEIVLTSGDNYDRQPLDELIQIAESLE